MFEAGDDESFEMGEVEAFGNSLSADDDIISAILDVLILFFDGFLTVGIFVEASDGAGGEEFGEFLFDSFGADTFVDDIRSFTCRAGIGRRLGVPARMADEKIAVGVESDRKKAGGAEGLPAASRTNSDGGGAAAVVKDHSEMVILDVLFDGLEDFGAEKFVLREILWVGLVDNMELGGFAIFDSEVGKGEKGSVVFC